MKNVERRISPETYADRREYERTAMELAGKLFLPAEELTMDCTIVDLSAAGAGLVCDEAPPLNSYVVLYIEGFGRYDAVTIRHIDGILGVRLVCREAKRQRLVKMLELFIQEGPKAITKLRRHVRTPAVSTGYFVSASGEYIPCSVTDISLQGVNLSTKARPSIGEIIDLGKARGRVVRHHEQGIGIQFLPVLVTTS